MARHITLLLIFSLFAFDSLPQWQPDMRLTNNPASSYKSYNSRCVASNGYTIHVVWWDERDGNREIYYKRSIDGGLSWGTDTRLTINTADSWFPSISVSGTFVHLVWSDSRILGEEIYYKRSIDGGVSWGTDTRLTYDPGSSYYPSISSNGSNVNVVWEDNRDGGWGIYYKRSTNAGTSWQVDTRITNYPSNTEPPCVVSSDSIVHVAWVDKYGGNVDIFYRRSTDLGESWGAISRLTNDIHASLNPSIAVCASIVHLAWHDDRDGNLEIYYKRSTDSGINWGPATRLTHNSFPSGCSSILASGSVVHLVWQEDLNANREIFYKRSMNNGLNWENDSQLTNCQGNSELPNLSISGTIVNVIWQDNRDGNFEIYCKSNPTGNPIGIKIIDSEIPSNFRLEQNYPNPFNSGTVIRFQLPKLLYVDLSVFDILGREVVSLVNEKLNPGTYEIEWDASGYPSAVYFYRIQTIEKVEVRKMMLVK